MLKDLCKLDLEWRKIALKICRDKMLADDLVNDMYIKMHRLNPDKWNKHYISYSIYHLYLNHIKKSKDTLYLEDLNIEEIENTNFTTEQRKRLDTILDEIGLLDREILLHTHEKSLRKTADVLLMSHGKLHYKKKNALEKLLNTNGIKQWKHEERQ
tara:strand:- start:438 stop:905 length:468 start_codon:yes stop_codon:yes gene_type:complete